MVLDHQHTEHLASADFLLPFLFAAEIGLHLLTCLDSKRVGGIEERIGETRGPDRPSLSCGHLPLYRERVQAFIDDYII